jgi:hypothetical protein
MTIMISIMVMAVVGTIMAGTNVDESNVTADFEDALIRHPL